MQIKNKTRSRGAVVVVVVVVVGCIEQRNSMNGKSKEFTNLAFQVLIDREIEACSYLYRSCFRMF